MRQTVARLSGCAGILIVALLCAAGTAQAEPLEPQRFYWHTSGQCSQTGQLGAEGFSCENAATSGYLATHVYKESEDFKLPTGQYCTYEGLPDAINTPESKAWFETPEPHSGYQEGNANSSVCAAWSSGPVAWGLQVRDPRNGQELVHHCDGIGLGQRCGIQRYDSLGSQGIADRPWASYFGERPSLLVYNPATVTNFTPEIPWKYPVETPEEKGRGWGWGYLCPVVENAKTGDILEVCREQWRGYASGPEWDGTHIAECQTTPGPAEHSIDKIVIENEAEGEKVFEFTGWPETRDEGGSFGSEPFVVSADRLEAAIALDDRPYTKKIGTFEEKEGKRLTDPGERLKEPELGDGCERSSATTPSEWALIGVSNGIEMWEEGELATEILGEASAYTEFEPQPIAIAEEAAASITETEETITGTVNPFGFETKYKVHYESPAKETAEATVGSGTTPKHVSTTLTGLKPSTTYRYWIEAFHPKSGFGEPVTGKELTFTTAGACGGTNVKGSGAAVQAVPQGKWLSTFNATCSAAKKEQVEYASTSSGAALASWWVGHSASQYKGFGTTNAFIATDQPPNETQEDEILEKAPGAQVLTIPVAQTAVALPIHLPEGCTAESDKGSGLRKTKRLSINDTLLKMVFAHEITKWSELATYNEDALLGEHCNKEAPIIRVVRKEGSGTTAILKKFLFELNDKPVDGSETWDGLAEQDENTAWPAETVNLDRAEKGSGVAKKVAETPGSIGYAALNEVREDTAFTPAGVGGEGAAIFWAELQRSGTKAEDPSTDGESNTPASANCSEESYVEIKSSGEESKYPPASAEYAWNEVVANNTQKGSYPLCGFTYDLALTKYSAVSPMPSYAEVKTVKDYLKFILGEGQTLIEEHDFMRLPEGVKGHQVRRIAEEGAFKAEY
jgi:ABC-type phosphate transport system substrate-binding protein